RPVTVEGKLPAAILRRPRLLPDTGLAQVIFEMLVTDDRDVVSIVRDHVLERSRRSLPIERVAAVGQEDQRNAAALQHAVHVFELCQWIGEMLQEMARNHEVLTRV